MDLLQKLRNLFGPKATPSPVPEAAPAPAMLVLDYQSALKEERDAPTKTIVNYVWVDKEPFAPNPEGPFCSVPFENINRMLENAARYPDAQFNLWLDFDTCGPLTRAWVQSWINKSGCQNVSIENLRSIDSYTSHPITSNPKADVFQRADIARLLVVQSVVQMNQDQPTAVVYSDFDCDDIKVANVSNQVTKTGLAIAEGPVGKLENSFFAVHAQSMTAQRFIQDVLTRNSHTPSESVYESYATCAKSYSIAHPYGIALYGMLHQLGYTIPPDAANRSFNIS